jgi:thiamine-monophosphate kinase
LDEFELIKKYIRPQSGQNLVLGAGDDCSVVEISQDSYLIETTDCLIEDVHFRLRDFSFAELAYKSLVVNLSDIAAMGGTPRRAHLTLAFPRKTKESHLAEFFQVFYPLCETFGLQLVGGDLSASPGPLFINIHLSGEAARTRIQWRRDLGRPGVLCVTGPLGDSSAGFACLENNLQHRALIQRHKRPPVELAKAQWLARQPAVQGMMDLSDGLASDLKQIPSGAIRIAVEQIPLSVELLQWAREQGQDPLRWAICGGEDYRLLFRCEKDQVDDLQTAFQKEFATPFFQIGEVLDSVTSQVQFFKNGEEFAIPWPAFRHF